MIFLFAFAIGPGLGGAANRVATQALNVEVGRRVGLATAMGLASTSFASGILLGSLLGGAVVELIGIAGAFRAAAAASFIGALLFALRSTDAATGSLVHTGISDTETADSNFPTNIT